MTVVRVHDLGTLRARVGDVDCVIGGPKPRTILAVLAIEVGKSVSVARLIDEVWGEAAGDKTGRALESQIWRLRKALSSPSGSSDVLATDAAGYRLVAGAVECDSVLFADLATRVDSAAAAGDHDSVSELADRALASWDGEPYGGASNIPLVDAARTRLVEMRKVVTGRRVEAWIASGKAGNALEAVDRLIAENVYDERWWASKIRALVATGQTARALATFGELRALLNDELGIEPGAEVQSAHRAALAADVPPASIVRLPARFSSFLGRDAETTRAMGMLTAARLTTILGPVGVGKSRLAIEVARRLAPVPVDGIFYVSLADVERAEVAAVIVSVLRLAPTSSLDPREMLRNYTSGRQMLLLLDDVDPDEHREFVEESMSWSAHLRVLATGARALGVDGEHVLVLDPLSTTPSGDRPPAAVRLLVDRIRASDSSFAPREMGSLLRICRAVDGLPLGIELAAARTLSFGIEEIAEQLGSELPAPILDSLDASYDQLPPRASSLHRALSVLPGPFTLDAARGVWHNQDAAGVLDELVRRSLLARYDTVPETGARRFVQLRAVRLHARQRAGSDRVEAVAYRREWVRDLISARPGLGDIAQKGWVERIDADYPTVLDALAEPEVFDGRELAQLTSYWFLRSRSLDGISVLTAARDAMDGASRIDRCALDLSLAATYAYAQRMDEARVLLAPWIPIDIGPLGSAGPALVLECALAVWVGDDHDLALTLVSTAVDSVYNSSLGACMHGVLAVVELTTGKVQNGIRRAHRALREGLENDNAAAAFLAATTLGIGALFDRDARAGLMWSRQSIEHFAAMGGIQIGDHLEQRGMHHSVAADWAKAVTLFGAAQRYCTSAGMTWPRHPFTSSVVEHCRATLGREFDATWLRGAALADTAMTRSTPHLFLESGL